MSDPIGKEDLKAFLEFRSEHKGRAGTELVLKHATNKQKKFWAHALLSEQKLSSEAAKYVKHTTTAMRTYETYRSSRWTLET